MKASRRRVVLAAVLGAFWAPSALAAEEEDTQPPAIPAAPAIEFGASGTTTAGGDARMREILREPDPFRIWTRWAVPFVESGWAGRVDGNVSSTEEGWLRIRGTVKDGSRVRLSLRRDRRPHAFRLRSPVTEAFLQADAGSLEDARERMDASWHRAMPWSGGSAAITVRHDRRSGARAALGAGIDQDAAPWTFSVPATRRRDERVGEVGATVTGDAAGARISLDAILRDETIRARTTARDAFGGVPVPDLVLASDERRRSVEAGVTVDGPARGALLAGGGYRVAVVQSEPLGSRSVDLPDGDPRSFRTEDADLSVTRHRAALGAAWLPLPGLRAGARATASNGRFRADVTERRRLADPQINRGRSAWETWNASAGADASWSVPRFATVRAEAGLEADRNEDRWSQTLLLDDRTTVVRSRLQDLDRDRRAAHAELSASTGPHAGVRLGAGARIESEAWYVEASEQVDARILGDRDRNRRTLFADARWRPGRGLTVDARGSLFEERARVQGADPERRGADLRVKARGRIGPASVHAMGALSDDRFELAPMPGAGATAGFAPLEFSRRSWIGTAGATVAPGRGITASASLSHVANAADLRSTLTDVAMDVAGPLSKTLRGGVGARWMRLADRDAPWDDGRALTGFAFLGGSF